MAFASNLTPTFPLSFGGHVFPGYTAVYTLVLNLVIAVVLTVLFRALAHSTAADETMAAN